MRRKKGNLDFIETPLTLDKILLRENFDNVNHGNRRTPTANYIWQYLRLISLKNSAGQIESKYVILSPEANYKKNDEEAIQAMTFGRPLKDFTGRELCYNLDGSFYKGWEYDKGNIKAEIKASNIDRLSGLQTRELLYLDCSPIWQSVCSANYGCTYSIIGQDCVTITASGGSTTSSDPFSMYFGFTSGGSSSGGSSAFDGMPTAIVGKCVTPEIPLCPGSIIVNNLNGTAYINMKDVNIGVRDINQNVISFNMPYVKITTSSMPSGGLDGLIRLAIKDTFSKIVQDIQDQASAKGLERNVSYKPGYKVFDIGNGGPVTMGDYFQLAFDGLYRAYINNWLQSTGINATYPATVIRSSDGAGYTPIVASDECQ